MWELYTGNYKILLKELREYLNKWRGIPCSWTTRFNIDFCTQCNIRENPSRHFVEINKLILKFIWKCTWPRTPKQLWKWTKWEDYTNSVVVASRWANRSTERTGESIEAYTSMDNWILIKVQRQFGRERVVFSTDSTGTTGYPYARKWTWIYTLHQIEKLTQNLPEA